MSGPNTAGERQEAIGAFRPSRVDRHAADGGLLMRAFPFALVMFAGWTVLFRVLGFPLAIAVIPAGLVTAAVLWAATNAASAAGRLFGRFLLPSGESTPYEHQFSREEAMAARGDVTGAIESL